MRTKRRAPAHISPKNQTSPKKKGEVFNLMRKLRDLASLDKQSGAKATAQAELMRGAWIDPDDAPEWTREQLEQADLYHGDRLVRAGRPPSANPKLALKLRIDPDVVAHFRATGPGWRTRINDTLRRAAKLPPRKYGPIER
jgi:uncharacterized protein (DUF4415 family)